MVHAPVEFVGFALLLELRRDEAFFASRPGRITRVLGSEIGVSLGLVFGTVGRCCV